jgi:hypothetical protein
LTLPPDTSRKDLDQIVAQIDRLAAAAQYGWGHTIDFGPFRKEGLLGEAYRRIAGALDLWGWWPEQIADLMRIVAEYKTQTGVPRPSGRLDLSQLVDAY